MKTRLYEVPVNPNMVPDGAPKTYLVEAASGPAAAKHVAAKFVGDPILPNGKRIAELMGSGLKPEQVKEEAPQPSGAGA